MNYLSLLVATVAVLAGSGSIVSVLGLRGLLDNLLAWFVVALALQPAYYPFFGKVRSAVAG